jgi:membrane-bound metal-dependent hydrolase YbcI (DUF457 family)
VYVGHIGIALIAKRAHPRASLLSLVLAAQACDWAQLALRLAGRTQWQAMLWSHSIPAAFGLMTLVGAGYAIRTKDARGAVLLAALVASHVAMDFITGEKPTWPGGPLLWGLGLYDYPILDFLLETPFVVFGWIVYRGTLTREAARSRLAWTMLAILLCIQASANAYFLIRKSPKIVPSSWTD